MRSGAYDGLGEQYGEIKRNKHVMCLRGRMKEVNPPESSWLLPSIHYGKSFLSAMAVQVLPVMDLGGNKSFFSSPPPRFLPPAPSMGKGGLMEANLTLNHDLGTFSSNVRDPGRNIDILSQIQKTKWRESSSAA